MNLNSVLGILTIFNVYLKLTWLCFCVRAFSLRLAHNNRCYFNVLQFLRIFWRNRFVSLFLNDFNCILISFFHIFHVLFLKNLLEGFNFFFVKISWPLYHFILMDYHFIAILGKDKSIHSVLIHFFLHFFFFFAKGHNLEPHIISFVIICSFKVPLSRNETKLYVFFIKSRFFCNGLVIINWNEIF